MSEKVTSRTYQAAPRRRVVVAGKCAVSGLKACKRVRERVKNVRFRQFRVRGGTKTLSGKKQWLPKPRQHRSLMRMRSTQVCGPPG